MHDGIIENKDSSLNHPSESLFKDIFDRDGVAAAGGHLFGVRSPGRVGDLGVDGKPSSLSISARNEQSLGK